ncbi:thap-type zinc finger [Holotrichia oblita]|uniref:Thap-type zinc finger n=1 Tax=Holotrichia oblita TaxID=644536 RepID=A0ACB9T8R6_HOLOL|nr:thap-type zinc finger [Holotrichia oblita]
MVRYRACSVKNCKDKTSTRHTFPNPTEDPERFSKWLEACRNSDLFNMHPHQVFSSRKVCDIHFPPAMKKSLKQLTTEAVPEQCLPQQLNIERPEGSHSRSLPVSIPDQIEVSAEPMPVAPLRNVDIQTLEDHYEVASQVQVTKTLEICGVKRVKQLTPKKRKLHKQIQLLSRSRTYYKKKSRTPFKEEVLDNLTNNLDPQIKTFVISQILQSSKPKKGRRFSINDKIMGLLLYKQSSRSYRLSEKLFCLPSKNTLKKLLSKLQINPGADDFIFNNLKKNELPEREKYCIIMFDEMSIQPNILFNTQTGQFQGFEDMGDRKSQHIANHVQVFMLKSVAAIIYGELDRYTSKIDHASGELRAMPKLTEAHVNPDKIRKMKVACATQVFSHCVASVMNLIRLSGTTAADGSSLDKNAEGTAILLKFFDSLFDSFNGSQKLCTNKPLKSYIKVGSPHFEFWSEAKKILSSMYFIDDKNRRHVPPSIKNWIITINGLIAVVKGLPEGITFLKGRSFNQDPLENFFGQMRQRGGQNRNPNSTQFKQHFRTFLINNITTRHSIHANCQNDANTVLSAMLNFVESPSTSLEENYENEVMKLEQKNFTLIRNTYLSKQATGYHM